MVPVTLGTRGYCIKQIRRQIYKINGKVALVSGCVVQLGIGSTIALRLVKEGAYAVVNNVT